MGGRAEAMMTENKVSSLCTYLLLTKQIGNYLKVQLTILNNDKIPFFSLIMFVSAAGSSGR